MSRRSAVHVTQSPVLRTGILSAALCLLVLAIAAGGLPASASADCSQAGLGGHKVTAATISSMGCFLKETEKAISNDEEEITKGVEDCKQQEMLEQQGATPEWVPVQKTGANLLDAVAVNIKGQQFLIEAFTGDLKNFERHYYAGSQALLSLRKASRDLTPYLLGDLKEAEKEAETAGHELEVHACNSATKHFLWGALKNIGRDIDSLETNLKATLHGH